MITDMAGDMIMEGKTGGREKKREIEDKKGKMKGEKKERRREGRTGSRRERKCYTDGF